MKTPTPEGKLFRKKNVTYEEFTNYIKNLYECMRCLLPIGSNARKLLKINYPTHMVRMEQRIETLERLRNQIVLKL